MASSVVLINVFAVPEGKEEEFIQVPKEPRSFETFAHDYVTLFS